MIATRIKTPFINFSDFLKLSLLSCLLVLELLPWLVAKLFLSDLFDLPVGGIYDFILLSLIANLFFNIYTCHFIFKSFTSNSELKKEFLEKFSLPSPTIMVSASSLSYLAVQFNINFIFLFLYFILIVIFTSNYRKLIVKRLYFLMPSFSERA